MDVEVHADHEAVSQRVADLLWATLRERAAAVVLAATGRTPMRSYELAAQRGPAPPGAIFVQLDEYCGVGPDDFNSLYGWMRRSLLDPLQVPDERLLRLDGQAGSPERGCRRHDRAIEAAGGIDLAVLGLGPNGHVGFNEPPSQPDSPSRVVSLSPESLVSNAVYWGEGNVPRHALTTGMAPILAARRVVLVATGEGKREILSRTLDDEPTADVPASLLRLARGEVVVLADRQARPGEQRARRRASRG